MPEIIETSKSISGFDPRSIGGCALWLDASDSRTITLSGANVTQINDKSGNGRNLPAVSGFANATVSSAFQNSLNVLNFSGNGLYRTAANSAVYPQDVYVIVALKSVTAHVDVLGMGATNTGNFNSLTFGEYTASRWHNGSDGFARTPNCVSPTNETSTGFLLIQWSLANNNFLLRRNGIQLIQTATYTYTLPAGSVFQVGFRHPDLALANFSGYLGEVLVFDRQLGEAQRQSIEGYLAWKWGLEIKPSLPTSISGLQLWLDGADASADSMTLSGNVVTTWKDKSGNGRNGTGSNSPVLTLNQQAGLSVVTLASASSQFFDFGNTLNLGTGGLTVFFVGRTTLAVNQGFIGKSSARGLAGRWYLISETTPSLIFAVDPAAAGTINASTSSTSTSGLFTIYSATMDRTTSNFLYTNGAVAGSAAFSNATNFSTTDRLYVGAYQNSSGTGPFAGYYYNGTIGEVIVYNTGLTASQRQGVESYLAAKWGLSVPTQILPPTHPFTLIRPFSRYFNPIDVPGCGLWLDAADVSSMTFSGQLVTRWNDKSGNGRNYTTYVNPPDYTSADGGGVTFNNGQTLYNSDSWIGNGAGIDIFVVSTPWPYTRYNDWRTLVRGSGHHVLIENNSERLGFYNGAFYQFGSLTLGNTKSLLYVTVNSAFVSSAAVNGTLALSLAGGTQASYSQPFYWVGGVDQSQPWGTINELLIFSNVTPTQRQQIEGYLTHKWNLIPNLPAVHSFKIIPPSAALPFSPTNIFSCVLWLDAGDASTISGTTNVTQWRDKSGNNRHLGVGGGTTTYANNVITIANSFMFVTSAVTLVNFTFFIVARSNSATGNQTVFGARPNTSPVYSTRDGFGFYMDYQSSTRLYGQDGVAAQVSTNSVVTSRPNIFAYTSGSTVINAWINGFPRTGADSLSARTNTAQGFAIGAEWSGSSYTTNVANVSIYEIVVYNSILSPAQRQQVEGHLAWKWGLTDLLLYPAATGFSAQVTGSGWIAYTFTSTTTSGTLVVPGGITATVDYLLVGGGGGASGYIGGGGGGGYYNYTTSASLGPGTYVISVGTGGIGQIGTNAPSPTAGGNTTIVRSGTTIATGPGGGGAAPIGGLAGSSGPFTGGSYNNSTINSGGGAGAGGNGANGGTNGGNGGTGVQFSITGTARFYGGGGGGGWYTGNVPGTGGAGGGANGAASYNPGSSNNGVNGLGGGGGGSTGGGDSRGGNGGSGVAIIRIYS